MPNSEVPKKQLRGFALLSPAQRSEVSRKGGRSAHMGGTAHKFTFEEARAAGRKGGFASKKARDTRREVEKGS